MVIKKKKTELYVRKSPGVLCTRGREQLIFERLPRRSVAATRTCPSLMY